MLSSPRPAAMCEEPLCRQELLAGASTPCLPSLLTCLHQDELGGLLPDAVHGRAVVVPKVVLGVWGHLWGKEGSGWDHKTPSTLPRHPEFSWGEATVKPSCLCSQGCPWGENCSGHRAEASRGCLFCYLIFFFFHFLLLFTFYNPIFSEFTCQKHHPNFISTRRTRLNLSIITYLMALLAFPHLQVTC